MCVLTVSIVQLGGKEGCFCFLIWHIVAIGCTWFVPHSSYKLEVLSLMKQYQDYVKPKYTWEMSRNSNAKGWCLMEDLEGYGVL